MKDVDVKKGIADLRRDILAVMAAHLPFCPVVIGDWCTYVCTCVLDTCVT